MLQAHAIAMTLDYFTISILLKYKTSHEMIMALIDFTIENESTGKATPGNSHTVKKVTGFYGISTCKSDCGV